MCHWTVPWTPESRTIQFLIILTCEGHIPLAHQRSKPWKIKIKPQKKCDLWITSSHCSVSSYFLVCFQGIIKPMHLLFLPYVLYWCFNFQYAFQKPSEYSCHVIFTETIVQMTAIYSSINMTWDPYCATYMFPYLSYLWY